MMKITNFGTLWRSICRVGISMLGREERNAQSIEMSEFLGDLYLRSELAKLATVEEREAFLHGLEEKLDKNRTALDLVYFILGTYAGNTMFKPKNIEKATIHPDFEKYKSSKDRISIPHLSDALRTGIQRYRG